MSTEIIRGYETSVCYCGQNGTVINHYILVAELHGIAITDNLWLVIHREATEYKVSFNY